MSFHAYRINELYSSADGKVQFIELNVGSADRESFWQGVSIISSSNGVTHSFTFPSNLPSTATSNTSVLIATQGFDDLGIVSPDFIVPDGFLFLAGGTLNYGGVDVVTYAQLPIKGSFSVNRAGELATATPTNFAGVQGSVPPTQIVPTITGTAGDDMLVGTVNAEIINGLAGDDTLKGGGGSDVLNGGTGSDLIYSGTGNDTIDGGDGYDYLYFSDAPAGVSINLSGPVGVATGGAGADTVVGVELIFGSKFNDSFVGSDSPVGFLGDDGDDTITGGAGDDHLEGNAGDDVIDGGGGMDTIAYYSAAFAVNVNLSAGTATGGLGSDTVRNVENVIGSVFSDTLTGDAFANRLEGGAGNDTLNGGTATDTAAYSGVRASFTLTKTGGGFTLADVQGTEGTDTLTNIERLHFLDKNIALDLGITQSAGEALLVLGTLAPAAIKVPSTVGLFINYFDGGHSLKELFQIALDAGLVNSIAGSSTNEALVSMIYRNFTGTEADRSTVDVLASYLDGRTASYSQVDFLTGLAGFPINQEHIGLVGLQQTGIEYSIA